MPTTTPKAYLEYEVELSGKRQSERSSPSMVVSVVRDKCHDIVLSAPILPSHFDKDRLKTDDVDIVLSSPVLLGHYESEAAVRGIHRANNHGSMVEEGLQNKEKSSASTPPQRSPSNSGSREKNPCKTLVFPSGFLKRDELDCDKSGRKPMVSAIPRVASDCQLLGKSSNRRTEFDLPSRQSTCEKNLESKSAHAVMTDPRRMRLPPKRSKNDSALLNSLARVASERTLMTAKDEQLVSSKHSGEFHSARSIRCQSTHTRTQGLEDPLMKFSRPLQRSESSRDLKRTLLSTRTCMSSSSHHRLERCDSTSTRNSKMPQRSISPQSSCSSFCCDDNSILSELTEENFMSSQFSFSSHNDVRV